MLMSGNAFNALPLVHAIRIQIPHFAIRAASAKVVLLMVNAQYLRRKHFAKSVLGLTKANAFNV